MRITFLMPADDLTGGNRVVATYARIFQERGHEVLVVSNGADRWTWREQWRALKAGTWGQTRKLRRQRSGHIAQSGVPHKVLERSRRMTAGDVPDADIIVATWWETAVWMHDMPLSKGRRVHLIQGYETWTSGDVRQRVHDALRLPNCKIAISSSLRRDIEADLGPLGMHVVPNAVDLARFDAPPRRRNEPFTVGFIYSAAPFKGADICLAAIAQVRAQLPALRVITFGTEPPAPGLPLPPGTVHTERPAQALIPAIYAQCDVWLFTSRVDSFGLPILESMACRTPVIGVPVGAAPELLADGAGRLIPPEDPVALAQAVLDLSHMPEPEWQAMCERAYQRAHSYSWHDAAQRFEQILRDLHEQ